MSCRSFLANWFYSYIEFFLPSGERANELVETAFQLDNPPNSESWLDDFLIVNQEDASH